MHAQISPSILNADFARLADECARVAGFADWLHVESGRIVARLVVEKSYGQEARTTVRIQ